MPLSHDRRTVLALAARQAAPSWWRDHRGSRLATPCVVSYFLTKVSFMSLTGRSIWPVLRLPGVSTSLWSCKS